MKFNKNEFGWKEKVGANTNELPDDLSIGNSLTVGIRIRDIGQYSVAEGYQNTASGENSHAEGESTTASGITSHAEGESTIASGECSHAEGCYTEASGCYSHAEGEETTASGNCSHAEGSYTTASGECSHAEGEASNLATDIIQDLSSSTNNDDILTAWNENSFSLAKGTSSHVEGKDNLALGDFSHAEGSNTTASGENSHTEGSNTTASGVVSHAEGESTIASGVVSHAEGFNTIASGNSSHAEGFNTIASSGNQHVQGKYNIEDTTNTYAHIVGNGTADNARSNAHTLDWQGNAWYKGKVSIEGTPTEDKDLTTKKYVDEKSILEPLPIYDTVESESSLLYIVNIMDLDKRKTYGAVQHGIDKGTIYRFVYICDDGSKAMITSFGDGVNENPIRVWHNTNSSTLYYGNYYYNIDYTNHATRKDVVVTQKIQRYLNINNNIEYTPSTDYHPATKKYVDDSIANQPTFSFNDSGELVVTINGVSKTFVPKQ